MTQDPQERLRELYRNNFLALILLPPTAVVDEYTELVRPPPPGRCQVNETFGTVRDMDASEVRETQIERPGRDEAENAG